VETIEVGRLARRVVGLTAEEIGLTLAEGKELLGELPRLILQTEMKEFATCARVCRDCMNLRRRRDNRTRKIQTLFGTITVDAPRISVCPCRSDQDRGRSAMKGTTTLEAVIAQLVEAAKTSSVSKHSLLKIMDWDCHFMDDCSDHIDGRGDAERAEKASDRTDDPPCRAERLPPKWSVSRPA
jgi:hypothetical protein